MKKCLCFKVAVASIVAVTLYFVSFFYFYSFQIYSFDGINYHPIYRYKWCDSLYRPIWNCFYSQQIESDHYLDFEDAIYYDTDIFFNKIYDMESKGRGNP